MKKMILLSLIIGLLVSCANPAGGDIADPNDGSSEIDDPNDGNEVVFLDRIPNGVYICYSNSNGVPVDKSEWDRETGMTSVFAIANNFFEIYNVYPGAGWTDDWELLSGDINGWMPFSGMITYGGESITFFDPFFGGGSQYITTRFEITETYFWIKDTEVIRGYYTKMDIPPSKSKLEGTWIDNSLSYPMEITFDGSNYSTPHNLDINMRGTYSLILFSENNGFIHFQSNNGGYELDKYKRFTIINDILAITYGPAYGARGSGIMGLNFRKQ